MKWRTTQLGSSLCDQDQLILKLFDQHIVRYVGEDFEFAKNLNQSDDCENLILIINRPVWCSDIIKICNQQLIDTVQNFYIGVNRHVIKGNDTTAEIDNTDQYGIDVINFLKWQLQKQGYTVTKLGYFDHDQGRYFNFVQPLTWVYGNKNSNTSN